MSVWRGTLIALTVLAVLVAVIDLVDLFAFATYPSMRRMVMLELKSVFGSVVLTVYLGWVHRW